LKNRFIWRELNGTAWYPNQPWTTRPSQRHALADAFRDFHLYAENTNFRAWIFRYLSLEILEHNRRYEKIRAEQPLPDELSTSEDSDAGLQEQLFAALAETPEVVLEHCDAALAAAIRQLGPQERSVLLLRAIGEFKYAEIADILEIPIGTVMSSLARMGTAGMKGSLGVCGGLEREGVRFGGIPLLRGWRADVCVTDFCEMHLCRPRGAVV
jgi:RNA polymerase sigma-70 factor, ECF subfamily